jgi:hypothetical protein
LEAQVAKYKETHMNKKPKQTCSHCPHVAKCFAVTTNTGKPVSTQNVLINILICRLQLGIDQNRAAANLLQLLRPGMIRLISHAKQSGNTPGIDMEQLLTEMQSVTIEYLLYDYKIGDRGRATPYLFDPHQGFLTKWIKWIIGKNRRFYSHHELYSPIHDSSEDEYYEPQHEQYSTQCNANDTGWGAIFQGGDSIRYDPYVEDEDNESEMSQRITDIINDGITLNSNEYRVITFCMSNANESNNTRHIDGLHIYLAKLMGVSRPRITRLYKRSKDKLKRRYDQLYSMENI